MIRTVKGKDATPSVFRTVKGKDATPSATPSVLAASRIARGLPLGRCLCEEE